MIIPRPAITLKRFNDLFSLVVAGLALYILILPLLPHIALWWTKFTDDSDGYVYRTNLITATEKNSDEDQKRKPIPQDNRLVLPSIRLDETVHEGQSAATLNKGLWRKPYTSTPDEGGNTVIAGHRFSYSDPAVFFHLNKIKEGDLFPVYWQGKEYDYEVVEVKIVPPTATEIEDNTEEPTITLYTCTPVWTSQNRLVIVAKLIGAT